MIFRPLAVGLLLALGCGPAAAADLALKPGDFVAVVGDSITEQKQYSVFVEDYLLMCRPAERVRVAQFGWSGETAQGFAGRMENDMLRFHPSVVTTCFGMNDGGYAPMTADKAARYQAAQTDIVRKCKAAGVRVIVVGSPGCVDANTFRKSRIEAVMYNETLAQERDIARDVARQEGVLFADVYAAMFDAMVKSKEEFGEAYHVGGGDGVHPDANGQLCMAFAFLKALGCSGEIGRIEVELSDRKVRVSQGHRVLSSGGGTIELESSRYPFCFYGDGKSPNSTRSILAALPFNAELNRFTLVATGGGAGRYKVTWGDNSKEFAASHLSAGINLAAEFLDNPFSKPFQKAESQIRVQQQYETPLVKAFLHDFPELQKAVPEETDALKRIGTRLLEKDQQLFDDAAAAVVPVKHTLKIELLP
jgi:lysophospholipase L1-like esterase